MWRRLAIVLPSAVLLGVGAAAIEVTSLVHQAQASERAAQAREALRLNQAATSQREALQALQQASAERDAAQAKVAELQPALDAAKADNAKLKDQVAALQAVSYVGGGQSATVSPGYRPVWPVAFPYGYCTYWVATHRLVTWSGNAINWWANARGIRPEGSQPQVGAIMVTAESWYGHVALVESVGSGSFVVSEMNYVGWGIVDSRTILPGRVPIIGFIY